jgi:hypothetical protein
VELQCRGGIDISMADATTGSSVESTLSLNLPNQEQFASDDLSLKSKFNYTSFLTTTSACPIDFYQVSDDFYDNSASATNIVS